MVGARAGGLVWSGKNGLIGARHALVCYQVGRYVFPRTSVRRSGTLSADLLPGVGGEVRLKVFGPTSWRGVGYPTSWQRSVVSYSRNGRRRLTPFPDQQCVNVYIQCFPTLTAKESTVYHFNRVQ